MTLRLLSVMVSKTSNLERLPRANMRRLHDNQTWFNFMCTALHSFYDFESREDGITIFSSFLLTKSTSPHYANL